MPSRAYLGLDTGFRKDPSAAVVVRVSDRRVEIAECVEIVPPKGGSLEPSKTIAQLLERGRYHGATTLITDVHYVDTVREVARGFRIIEAPSGVDGKALVYTTTRREMNEGRLVIPGGNRKLIAQLREVVCRPTPGGNLAINSPRRGGSHGDLVSALTLAVWAAVRGMGSLDMHVHRSPGRWSDHSFAGVMSGRDDDMARTLLNARGNRS